MTRALQLDILLSGLRDPDTLAPLAGGTVYFYAAGTTTPKNVWSEKAKTNAYTSVTLDANGSLANPYYGDGWYKLVVKDSDGNTEYTWDQIYFQSNAFSVVQKTETYTATPDDDVILCDGTFTLNLQTVANFEHPLEILNTGSGTITIDAYSTQTIEGSLTLSLGAGEKVRLTPDVVSNTWRWVDFISDVATHAAATGTAVHGLGTMSTQNIAAITASLIPNLTNSIDIGNINVKVRDIFSIGVVYLDADNDTYLYSNSDDSLILTAGGANYVQLLNTSLTLSGLSFVRGGVAQGYDTTAAIYRKIVNIGDWNMDATASITVAHGLTLSKIRTVKGIIQNDAGTLMLPCCLQYPSTNYIVAIYQIDATSVYLVREAGTIVDTVDYNATSFNRGWLIIEYVD